MLLLNYLYINVVKCDLVMNQNCIMVMISNRTLTYQKLLLFVHVWKCTDAAAIMYMSIKTQFSLMNN